MKKIITKYLLVFVFFLILLEIFSLIFSKLNLLYVNYDPDYIHSYGNNWRTENTKWGSWHKKNYTDVHSSKCFNVEYKSNNIGARDNDDYNLDKIQDSILLIGDSHAEGYGVNFEDTFHQKLQNKITKKILNFGTAGNFGTVQSYLIYKNLASKYKHSEIIYFFNPASDFIDNDWNYWKTKVRKFRNRPYFIYDDLNKEYKIYYPNDNSNKITIYFKDIIFLKIKPFLLKYTYTANTLRTINFLISQDQIVENTDVTKKKIYSSKNKSYFNNDKLSVNGTIYFIEKFLELAKNKKVTILIIPHKSDLELISKGNNFKNLNWFKKLKKISKKYNVKLINFTDFVDNKNYKQLIHTCDDHWNAAGNNFAANIVLDKIPKINP